MSVDGIRIRRALDAWDAGRGTATSSITGSGAIREVELWFHEHLDGRHALALPSGSAALRVALQAVGVRRDSEVICSAFDWPAARSAITSLGALPVPADIDPSVLTIDATSVAERVTERTSAIIATHVFGIPADIPRLMHVGRRAGVPVIEDCAQALGATFDGTPVGALADAAAFSFGPEKIVDAGEGGLVAFRRRDHHRNALRCSQHPVRQLAGGVIGVDADAFELRMHPAAAMLAWYELAHLPGRLVARRRRATQVLARLGASPTVTTHGGDTPRVPSWDGVPFTGRGGDGLTVVPSGARLLHPLPVAADLAPRVRVALLKAM